MTGRSELVAVPIDHCHPRQALQHRLRPCAHFTSRTRALSGTGRHFPCDAAGNPAATKPAWLQLYCQILTNKFQNEDARNYQMLHAGSSQK